ncbi:hypothetical protein H7J73_30275 [Mycolicibacterium komossense]|uniref:Transmembrane protein n=1 Tax=Mycolicibacterium komossense TaxID=1779 RepID=A0ABT3CLC9_9MYCO|nr:hypothetical protein [Mycolicibacterium komossense]
MTPTGTPPPRPPDVDLGFWLWVIALPLLVTGYIADAVTLPSGHGSVVVLAVTIVFVCVLSAVVVTFLILMRHGYRWARTLLTGGGIGGIVSVCSGVFDTERPAVAAVIFAVTGIIGAVLIAGGIFLLHRKDAQAFFTR